jgi:hypothetical protein
MEYKKLKSDYLEYQTRCMRSILRQNAPDLEKYINEGYFVLQNPSIASFQEFLDLQKEHWNNYTYIKNLNHF